jgi:hypothetical protein
MGAWHACAKLRIQTESTLAFLKQQTRELGAALRLFAKKVCSAYETRELPSEAAARLRRGANAAKKGKKAAPKPGTSSKTTKSFNLNTYKIYAMGHYFEDIQNFGTIDNYSTLIVHFLLTCFFIPLRLHLLQGELEHKQTKKLYGRTNKRKNYVAQTTVHYRREQLLRRIGARARRDESMS